MPFLIIGGAILFVLVSLLAVCRWVYEKAFYVPKHKKFADPHAYFGREKDEECRRRLYALVDMLADTPAEDVSIVSYDGLRLAGHYYHHADGAPVKIIFHGWRSTYLRDCGGGAEMAWHAGYNLLLVDQRALGGSEGHTITFGIKEKYDCLSWIQYVIDRFGEDVKIILGGISMGAATVLMASALDLPKNVKCISADCGFTSPEAIIRKVCREDMGVPDWLGFPFVRLGARIFGGFSIRDGGALEAVKHAKVPLMIMHGDEDDFVPFSMCHEIYNAIPGEKVLLTVEGAGHGLSYFEETERYEATLRDFESRALMQ
ncbi:MAG: alpha/beta hydrolase [Clostridia bacterium]|nr:alpha/beta hydrolase [Clostridia bacterium]